MAGIIPLLIAGEGSHYYSMLRINDIKGAMAQRHNGGEVPPLARIYNPCHNKLIHFRH